jgi:hypothetical protein
MDITYYTTYDLPIPYKGLLLYPVSVKDYLLFSSYAQCLSLDKNSIPDAKIIAMTYLDYLYHLTGTNSSPYIIWLDRVLAFCLKDDKSFEDIKNSIDRYKLDEKSKAFIIIGDKNYTGKDFLEMRSIICQQNMIELIDENVSKEVRDSLEEAREYKNKLNNSKPGSLEDYITSLATVTGWTLDYIYSMSIRKFIKCIRRMDNLIHYKIYLTASISGMVEFKDKSFIKHWLTDIEDGEKYGDVSVDLTEMQQKVSMESAKK